MSSGPKKLFLVDAMAHVYRAFFAPMPQRLTGPGGIPTNIPFLFGNILRRLIKDYQPDYIGIVFDPPGATFRDKLFEKYKAQRQPMPDEMRVQLPFVRRMCERCAPARAASRATSSSMKERSKSYWECRRKKSWTTWRCSETPLIIFLEQRESAKKARRN